MINEATPGAANAVCHPPNVARTPVKTAAPGQAQVPSHTVYRQRPARAAAQANDQGQSNRIYKAANRPRRPRPIIKEAGPGDTATKSR